jgi:hypothetical protein
MPKRNVGKARAIPKKDGDVGTMSMPRSSIGA